MARKKRTSKAIETATLRLNGLNAIDSALDLGNGVSNRQLSDDIVAAQAALDEYNSMLSTLDNKLNELVSKEKALRALSERSLKGVGVRFGFDSNEYEMAGGTRKSERKRPVRKTPPQ